MIRKFFAYIIAFFYLVIFCFPIAGIVYVLLQVSYSIGMVKRFIKKRFYDNRTKNRK